VQGSVDVLTEYLSDLSTDEVRIAILHAARGAWAEAGEERNAAQLERFLHGAELQLAGASDEEILRAFEGLGRPGGLEHIVELIDGASRLWARWGHERNAAACKELAGFYRKRWELGEWNIENRSHRLEALEVARKAHDRAGHEDAADLLRRAIRLGQLQQEGADDEKIAKAAEGLSNELLIELVRRAAALCREQGSGEGATTCEALADFYRRRGNELAREPAPAPSAGLDRLERRLVELEAELEALRAKLEELRRRSRTGPARAR